MDVTLESPLDCKESNQSILKEISVEYSLGGLMLNLILHYFSHLMRSTDSLEMTLILGKIEGGRRVQDGEHMYTRSRLCVCRAFFLMTFAMGGVPHAGPQHRTTVMLTIR